MYDPTNDGYENSFRIQSQYAVGMAFRRFCHVPFDHEDLHSRNTRRVCVTLL